MTATVDTLQHRITLSPRTDPRQRSVLAYELVGTSGLRVHGVQGADSIDVTLRRSIQERCFACCVRRPPSSPFPAIRLIGAWRVWQLLVE
jgi:hypothetical protein